MNNTTINLKSYTFENYRTYLLGALFIAGNIILPQLFHFIPQGGLIWLPIYFFTLIGAVLFGWRVGLLTAAVSPMVNSLLFGMPAPAIVPVIVMKSACLVLISEIVSKHSKKTTLGTFVDIVLGYQILGTICEWAYWGNLNTALQDFRLGIPGMLMQVFLGYIVVKTVLKINE